MVAARVRETLSAHDDLVAGFNVFLPEVRSAFGGDATRRDAGDAMRTVEGITMRSWRARTRASSARTGVIRCIHYRARTDRSRVLSATRSQDARGGPGATASTARRRGGTAAKKQPRGRGRPRGSTKAAAAAAAATTGRGDDDGDDDRAVYDRREVRSKATRHRSRVRFDRYRTIDRSVTGGSRCVATVRERSMCPSRRRIAI